MSTPEQTPETPERAKRANWVQRLVRLCRLWLNATTAVEGCTMVDARKMREYNHALADENARLREKLRECRRHLRAANKGAERNALVAQLCAARAVIRSGLPNDKFRDTAGT